MTKKQPPSQTIKTTNEEKEYKDFTLDYSPLSDTPNVNTNGMMCIMITNDEKSMGSMDLTGSFPHYSASFHEYLLVGYYYDDNAMLVEPIKNR